MENVELKQLISHIQLSFRVCPPAPALCTVNGKRNVGGGNGACKKDVVSINYHKLSSVISASAPQLPMF